MPRRWAGPSATPAPKPKPEYKPERAWDKLLVLVGAAVVVAALLIAPGILNRGGQNPVAEAAQATLHWPGARMTFTASGTGPGATVKMTGGGVMNGETNRASIQLNATVAANGAAGSYRASQVDDGSDFYFHFPEISQAIGEGAPWLLIRGEAFGSFVQQGEGGFMKVGGVSSPSGPREQLNELEGASSDIQSVGREEIRGAMTTHYTGTIDFQKYLDNFSDELSDKGVELFEKVVQESHPTEKVDVWIDDQGLIRRESATASTQQSNEVTAGSVTTTVEFFDFGIHPEIAVPAPGQVHDITPMLQQAIEPFLKD